MRYELCEAAWKLATLFMKMSCVGCAFILCGGGDFDDYKCDAFEGPEQNVKHFDLVKSAQKLLLIQTVPNVTTLLQKSW